MESKAIIDAQISASSQLDGNHSAAQARLYFTANEGLDGGWSALTNDLNQWLQVDLGSYTRVTRVATQGRNGHNEWVAKYMLQYSDHGTTFLYHKDAGDSAPKVFLCVQCV